MSSRIVVRPLAAFCLAAMIAATPLVTPASDAVSQAVSHYAGLTGTVDATQARTLFEQAAAEGDVVAQFWLVRLGALGRAGLALKAEEVQSQAAALLPALQAAADAGKPGAAFCLASAYQWGWGTKADLEKAFTLYGDAAAKEHDILALHNMALLLLRDKLPMERATALAACRGWAEESSNAGNAYATFLLGGLAEHGLGEAKDLAKAEALYTTAADAGFMPAKAGLARLLEKKEPAEQERAAELFRAAAEAGDLEGMRGWARCQATGSGTAQDLTAALATWQRMADAGDGQALRYIGLAYVMGEGVERDEAKGRELLLKAQAAGDRDAGEYLSLL